MFIRNNKCDNKRFEKVNFRQTHSRKTFKNVKTKFNIRFGWIIILNFYCWTLCINVLKNNVKVQGQLSSQFYERHSLHILKLNDIYKIT